MKSKNANGHSYYVVIAQVKGSDITEKIAQQVADDLRAERKAVTSVVIEVCDDIIGMPMADSDESFVELSTGERVRMTDDHLHRAARACVGSIPEQYRLGGITCPEAVGGMYDPPENGFKLHEVSAEIVLARDPDQIGENHLIEFLSAVMSYDEPYRSLLWWREGVGRFLISKILKSSHVDSLCQIIETADANDPLVQIVWSISQENLENLSPVPARVAAAKALLNRRDKLPKQAVFTLEKIIGDE